MPTPLTDADKVIRNDTGLAIVQAIQGISAPAASNVPYDNTISGLTADDVQEAVDELSSEKMEKVNPVGTGTFSFTGNAVLSEDLTINGSQSLTSFINAIKNQTTLTSKSGPVVSFNTDIADRIYSCYVNLMPSQVVSGDASPSNNKPITGWSSINLTRTGKNLCPYLEAGQLSQTDGSEVPSDTVRRSGFIRVEENTDYTCSNLSNTSTQTNKRLRVFYYDRFKNYITNETTELYDTSINVTIPSGTGYIRFQASGTVLTETNAQVEKGTTPTAYEAYKGITVVISLGSTYYGGILDLYTGKFTVTHALLDMADSNITWQRVAAGTSTYVFMYNTNGVKASNFNFGCSCYKAVEKTRSQLTNLEIGTYNSTNAMDRFCIRDDNYTDATTFKNSLTGQTIAYELATYTEVQLTVNQISALLGANNVYADCGDVSLKYLETIGNNLT